MGSDASAYRALGLEPGADPAAVEAAYRGLIKRYHPDRAGGDAARAAEINWAYHHIRKARQLPTLRRSGVPAAQPALARHRPKRRRWPGVVLACLVAMVVVESFAIDWSSGGFAETIRGPVLQPASGFQAPSRSDFFAQPIDRPLDADAIDRSVMSAVRLAGSGEMSRLTRQSRRCHAELRREPDLSRFDQCVAFDEAAVVLMHRNQLGEEGQFSSAAVTGRNLGAARIFSADYLMIESRLDRIRSRVEFSLAPPDPHPVPQLEL